MRRYESVKIKNRWDGKRSYIMPRYPTIRPKNTDIIVISKETDYLDSLAFKYYGDPTLWWIIALSNNLGNGKMNILPGIQLRIPVDIQQIINSFDNLNK